MKPLKSLTVTALAAVVIIAVAAPPSSALEIKRMTLNNGAVLLVSEEHQLPMVTMAIAFDAGARRDPKGEAGLAELTAESLMQGTKQLKTTEFNRKADFMGSAIGVSAGHDYTVATLKTLKKYQGDTLKMLTEVLQDPGLRDADIERKRADMIANIKANQEQPGYVAAVAFRKQLFGASPYAHPIEGYADTVEKLTPEDVRNFYRTYYKFGSAVIAVAGDVDANHIKDQLNQVLTGLSGKVPAQGEPPLVKVPPGIHLDVINRSVAQANLILGSGGIARSNPDYYEIQVMNYILGGGGFASRLTKVVRSKHGLAYSIGSEFEADKFPGPFAVVLQTKNQSSNEALKLILEQLQEIRESPVSGAEMQSAKKFLIGSFPLKLDRQSQIVGFMLDVQLNHLGLDYADKYPQLIDAVNKAEVQKVAREYVHPHSLLIVAVADQPVAKISQSNFAPEQPAATTARK
ncbi:MAG: M16 family metallopeptidase [Candidatus Binataceae bacterium]